MSDQTIDELVQSLADIIEYQTEKWHTEDAPGHCHTTPGRWDNGIGRCEWCAKWAKAKAVLAKVKGGAA